MKGRLRNVGFRVSGLGMKGRLRNIGFRVNIRFRNNM